jgi:hypothetical protein
MGYYEFSDGVYAVVRIVWPEEVLGGVKGRSASQQRETKVDFKARGLQQAFALISS